MRKKVTTKQVSYNQKVRMPPSSLQIADYKIITKYLYSFHFISKSVVTCSPHYPAYAQKLRFELF